jgi:hypothetical protein
MRRVLSPERDVLNVLLRRDMPHFDAEVLLYFQDVYEHTIRSWTARCWVVEWPTGWLHHGAGI